MPQPQPFGDLMKTCFLKTFSPSPYIFYVNICPPVELTATAARSAQEILHIMQFRRTFMWQSLKKVKPFIQLLEPTVICKHKNEISRIWSLFFGTSNISFCLWQKVSEGFVGKHANNIRHTKLWPSIENREFQKFSWKKVCQFLHNIKLHYSD